MLERMRQTILQHHMLAPGDCVVVAVSGGPDSVALLNGLHRLAPELGVSLHIFHMNHGLRGEQSEGDARYVRELASRLALPCTVAELAPGALKHLPGSLQANARTARYAEIEALCARIGANRVALGHNRDDQAETVLMRFLRGTGTRGLAGIPAVRPADGVTYIRPLLGLARTTIEEYCRQNELFPRFDESNGKPDYLRNRIRLHLLPQLSSDYNPALAENLAQMAEVMRAEDQFLDTLAMQALERCRASGNGLALSGPALLAEPLVLARRVVRVAARMVGGPTLDLGLEPVTRVLEAAARSEGSHRLDLPGGLVLRVEYGICHFTATHDEAPPAEEWPVALTGVTEVPELGIRLEGLPAGRPAGPFEALFDADAMPGPLSIRLRRPGDRVWPAGMEGSKKLQDLLVDAKVPKRLRDRVPLLVSGNEILWVIGHRLDRRFLATPETKNVRFFRVTVLT